ncbi:Tm-1-like ATP-binding domain-containing protein [Bradyrhizobium manausense]|uniref:Tm-1-like ATP-binding domain-containing protein n=1 Tax=Bradyrhizobium manausense TaxID=989370 RepID=UPI001BAB58C8|nr:Tm-1-like ATP-binding domain-containing protein [Bradyrhizobium manausense]MBR0834206.1 Tm-1-like ATP-binding domain-containing protein [Bradyrhizobium manausense]
MNPSDKISRESVLIIGTVDTKFDELAFLRDCVVEAGGRAVVMDVGVRNQSHFVAEITNREVAAAAGVTLEDIADSVDENVAMQAMTRGAIAQTLKAFREERVHGVLVLGGTMGTDLALDVTAALPVGVPKFLISTVSFSHLIPPERLAPDLMAILWAGGLYGLNSLCRSSLRMAANAVVGACRNAAPIALDRPIVGISSLGTSALRYIVALKPALEQRGYEVAVFHATGMGGRALESLAAQKTFAAVLDLCLQEVANDVLGSIVTAGEDRLENAGRMGIPQIVAPGAIDMIDMPSWKATPHAYVGRPRHAHNRLIASVVSTASERRAVARAIVRKLASSKGKVKVIVPREGIQEWDRKGQPLYEPEAHQAFVEEFVSGLGSTIDVLVLDAHINDGQFTDSVMAVFDDWVRQGVIPQGVVESSSGGSLRA